jgi:hypothetical protein
MNDKYKFKIHRHKTHELQIRARGGYISNFKNTSNETIS